VALHTEGFSRFITSATVLIAFRWNVALMAFSPPRLGAAEDCRRADVEPGEPPVRGQAVPRGALCES
jgi:hypothetical protein